MWHKPGVAIQHGRQAVGHSALKSSSEVLHPRHNLAKTAKSTRHGSVISAFQAGPFTISIS